MSRVNLADVAARAGVSTATASLVLRGRPGPSATTRESVEAAAAELAYRPDRTASLLATRDSRQVGVVLDVRSSFHAEFADVLDGAAETAGFDLVLSSLTRRRDERGALDVLLDFRCAAVVLLGTELPDADLLRLSEELPVVVAGRRDVPGVTCIATDESAGIALAVDHLADLGHQRIAFVDGPRWRIATTRRAAYRTAMRRRGLGEHIDIRPGGADEAKGLAAGQRLLTAGDLPTAVLAFNDRCAVGVRVALARGGVAVPEQVSVIGYDDSPLARLATVDLTSVNQNLDAMAEATMRALRDLMGGGTPGEERLVPPSLSIRSTTARPEQGDPT